MIAPYALKRFLMGDKKTISNLCSLRVVKQYTNHVHMKIIRLLLLVTLLTLTACANDEGQIPKPTLEDFQTHLKADMDYKTLVSKFGEPAKDVGSGIHIFVYLLPDSTEVWIGYVDTILYARQVDAQGKELLRII